MSHPGERSPHSPISHPQLMPALNTNTAPLVTSGTWPGGSSVKNETNSHVETSGSSWSC